MSQPPQLFKSLPSVTHTPPQFVCPPGHTITPQTPDPPSFDEQHAPPMQKGVSTLHRTLHPPQFAGSTVMSRQRPAQHACPVPHGTAGQVAPARHTPLMQLEPAPHRLLQPPQLFESLARFASQPLATAPSQLPKPRAQAAMPHIPPAHDDDAFGALHTLPHAPQLLGSLAVIAQNAPQHCVPPGHGVPPPHSGTHNPAEHARPAPHARPHAPQFARSVCRSLSQPFIARPSQSPNPRAQFATTQRALTHAAAPFAIGLHAMPQPPQLFGSLPVGVQAEAQHVRPAPQSVLVQPVGTHAPAEHASSAPH